MKAMRSVVVTIATGFAVGADGSSTMYTRCTRLASIMSIARDTGVSAPQVIRGTYTHEESVSRSTCRLCAFAAVLYGQQGIKQAWLQGSAADNQKRSAACTTDDACFKQR